ncbi:unnamed protein product, partial [Polarella glacialis]
EGDSTPGATPHELLAQARARWCRGDAAGAMAAAELAVAGARALQPAAAMAPLLALAESQLAVGQFADAEASAGEALSLVWVAAALEASTAAAAHVGGRKRCQLLSALVHEHARALLAKEGPEEAREALAFYPRLGITWGEAAHLLAEAEASTGSNPADESVGGGFTSSEHRRLLELSALGISKLADGPGADQARSCLRAALELCRDLGVVWSRSLDPFLREGQFV